jgi:spore maturation protein CgeB
MKILITGNIFHNYEYSFQRAFESIGHSVELCFLNIEGPFFFGHQTFSWIKYGLLPHKLGVNIALDHAKSKYNAKIKSLIKNHNFDLLLVIKGLTIDSDILKEFSGIKVLWVFDSIKRLEILHSKLSLYDKVFSFEPSDVSYCHETLGQPISFLPLAVDPTYYSPITAHNQYDLSFVGGNTPNREALLKTINDKYNLALVGDFYKSKSLKIKSHVVAKYANHQFINRLYNSTKVNLNIHNPQSKEAVNIRFFEIMAARGGVQFVERQKAFLNEFKDGEDLVYYSSREELEEKLAYYTDKEDARKKIANSGFQKTMDGHTWKHRAEQLLQAIE